MYGWASRRSTVAAAAGAPEGLANVAAASGGGRADRDHGTLRKRGLAPSDVRSYRTCSSRAPAPRSLGRRGWSRFQPKSDGATV
jgi:hypothetical protein